MVCSALKASSSRPSRAKAAAAAQVEWAATPPDQRAAVIRRAAQLLEANVAPEDRELTTLIRDEADRIRDLVDRMEIFGEKPWNVRLRSKERGP